MDIYQSLRSDHREVETLLEQLSQTRGKSRIEGLQKLKLALIPHARAEEKVFYAAMLDRDSREEPAEGYEEHRLADQLLKELEGIDPEDERWQAKLSVLKENLEHHIQEEESDIFEEARSLFSAEEADTMGRQFLELKEEYKDTLPTQGQIHSRAPKREHREELSQTGS